MKIRKLGIIFFMVVFITGCGKSSPIKPNDLTEAEIETKSVYDAKTEKDTTFHIQEDASEALPTASPEILPEIIAPPVVVQASPTPEAGLAASNNGYIKALEGKVICIDPGHGNPNHTIVNEPIAPSSDILKPSTAYGTTGVATGIPEYKLTLAVSLKIRDQLEQKGARVVMTRESNEVDLGNIERSEIANNIPADISIRIHADGFDNSSVTGISVLYPGSQYISNSELLLKSKAAAKDTLDELLKTTNAKSRGIVERNDLTGFNWSKVPVILVEMGFMTNPAEDERLNSEEYQDKLAEGIVNGLIKYFENY